VPTGGFRIEGAASAVVGRGAEADVLLTDETVSRRHCTLERRGGRWFVADVGSRSGTLVNGVRLEPMRAAALADGDLVTVGRCVLRVAGGAGGGRTLGGSASATLTGSREVMRTVADSPGEAAREVRTGQGLAAKHLAHLMGCAQRVATASDETQAAGAVVEAAAAVSGFARAALLRAVAAEGEETEVLAFYARDGSGLTNARLSRSLIRKALEGKAVRLSGKDSTVATHSIAEIGIASALCLPVMGDAGVDALLYLDAGEGDRAAASDSTADFCAALASLFSLALARLNRQVLEERRQRLETELNAAREVQELILPRTSGTVGAIRYAVTMRPGQIVAGDLFDVFEVPGGKVAVCLGDVTGEGAGAAILMASAQSSLHTALVQGAPVAEAVSRVNRYLAAHSPPNRFVSLWVGVFDAAQRAAEYVDAGHGHWLTVDGTVTPPARAEGIPLAIEPEFEYQAARLALAPSARIVLYSDGVVEQRAPGGEEFGAARLRAALERSASADEDCRRVEQALRSFAGATPATDDTTAASIGWA